MKLTSQDINDLMGVVGNRIDDLSDAGLAYTDDGDTDEIKRLYSLYGKLKALSEENGECPKGTHESLDEALGCWKCQNASLRARRAKNE